MNYSSVHFECLQGNLEADAASERIKPIGNCVLRKNLFIAFIYIICGIFNSSFGICPEFC